jgi:hypothetical protein
MSRAILHDTAVMISDIHVGDPLRPDLDDFQSDDDFARLLSERVPAASGGAPATLVIAGDFLDFPQVLPELARGCPGPRFGLTQAESVARVTRMLDGHPKVFSSLAAFLAKGNQVLVLPGNHDIDLHWPEVFAALRHALGDVPEPTLRFVSSGSIHERGVYIEHGNQYAFDNRFEHWGDPIVRDEAGVARVERPWGTWFMDAVYNDVESLLPFVNKVQSDARLLAIALRLALGGERRKLSVVAKLVAFIARHGRRFLLERALGAGETAPGKVSRAEATELVGSLDATPEERGLLEGLVLDELRAEGALDESPGAPRKPDVLGHDDDRGMGARARSILQRNDTPVVAFGHTHEPVDAKALLGRDHPGRVYNTGGWIPNIDLRGLEVPTVEDLRTRERVTAVRYLVVRWKDGAPAASLEKLTAR